ncbi:MAG: hypothetical protein LBU19_04245, partial [Treponema sp.]|nr:hypothetical protein [Treponema sp.]
ITNGAKINFENITVTGGDTPKDGGGVYIDGDCDIQFSGSTITGNKAGGSGGGVYIHGPASGPARGELSFYGGSISGNTAAGSHTSSADPGSTQGGGGLYVGGRASIWLNNATVANNTAEGGSGGGVLVNGSVFPGPDNSRSHATAEEYGLIMTEGNISGNKSMGSKSPHGGGGIYVAQGAFEMWGGEISGNTSKRQGGGVFIWHNADFRSSGNSRFINNTGVGSSKDICSRGYTTLAGHTRADRVYVWNNNGDNKYAEPDAFYIGEDARITTGLVLAYDDTPSNPRTRNLVNVLVSASGTDRIANIDLEGHLTGDKFVDTDPEGDWLGVDLVDPIGANTADIGRFTLGAFTGKGDVSLGPYTLDSDGRMVRR